MRGATKLIIAIIIIIILAGGGYALFHKSSYNNSSNNSSGTYGSPLPASNNSASSNPPASGVVIQTKTDASLGQYLADGSGKTLYTYNADSTNTSNCTGSCLSNWPAYIQTSTSASLPANVSTFKRTDNGATQYTYKGMPLYYFTGDSSAGQVTGNNVENFRLAKP